MPIIYHVTTRPEWDAAREKGRYESPSLVNEGFIHCSADDRQVKGVVERYFKEKNSLVKLVIDTDMLTSPFIYEWSPSTADTFPHVYGPINTGAVTEVVPIENL